MLTQKRLVADAICRDLCGGKLKNFPTPEQHRNATANGRVAPERKREPELKIIAMAFAVVIGPQIVCARTSAPLSEGAPNLQPGQSWEYVRTDLISHVELGRYTVTVTASDGDKQTFTETQDGGDPKAITSDRNWSMPTEISGRDAVYRYLDFPLTPGKQWQTSRGWENDAGDAFQGDLSFKVVGAERITVPAGTFDTVKVVGTGIWSKLGNRNRGECAVTVWYAPQVMRAVRYDWFKGAYRKGSPGGHSDQLTNYHTGS